MGGELFPDKYEYQVEVNIINEKLKSIYNLKHTGAQIRAKVMWAEKGEQSTKYFLGLEKSRGKQKIMSSLKMDDGKTTSKQSIIINEQVKYYERLYKKKINFDLHKVKDFKEM